MSDLFNENQMGTMRKIRKWYLTAILWTLIVDLAVWVIVILASDSVYDPVIGKVQTMFLAFAACALLNVGAFRCLELGDNKAKVFAVVSFVTAIAATVFDLLLVWEVFPGLDANYATWSLSAMSKITLSTALTSVMALLEANVLMIKNAKKSTIIVVSAIVAFFYVCFLVSIFGVDLREKFGLLLTVVPLASLLIYFVATRITKLDDVSTNKLLEEMARKQAKQKQDEDNGGQVA